MRIIAGPCQHESYAHSLKIATECKRVCEHHGFEYIFKASFDKANRSYRNSEIYWFRNHLLNRMDRIGSAKKPSLC